MILNGDLSTSRPMLSTERLSVTVTFERTTLKMSTVLF